MTPVPGDRMLQNRLCLPLGLQGLRYLRILVIYGIVRMRINAGMVFTRVRLIHARRPGMGHRHSSTSLAG